MSMDSIILVWTESENASKWMHFRTGAVPATTDWVGGGGISAVNALPRTTLPWTTPILLQG